MLAWARLVPRMEICPDCKQRDLIPVRDTSHPQVYECQHCGATWDYYEMKQE